MAGHVEHARVTEDVSVPFHVTDTIVRGSYFGIWLDSFETYTRATILRTRVLDGVFGINVHSGVHATIKDSVIAGHAVGVVVSDDISASDANLEDCLVTGNRAIY